MQALSAQRLIVRRYINLHLLNLTDGSPHHAPPSNVIRWYFPMSVEGLSIGWLAITGSRLMMYVSCWEAGGLVWRVLVWDWKIGDLVSIPRVE